MVISFVFLLIPTQKINKTRLKIKIDSAASSGDLKKLTYFL
jgi:hypothetical protein